MNWKVSDLPQTKCLYFRFTSIHVFQELAKHNAIHIARAQEIVVRSTGTKNIRRLTPKEDTDDIAFLSLARPDSDVFWGCEKASATTPSFKGHHRREGRFGTVVQISQHFIEQTLDGWIASHAGAGPVVGQASL